MNNFTAKFPKNDQLSEALKKAIFGRISKINPLSCSRGPDLSFGTKKSRNFCTGRQFSDFKKYKFSLSSLRII
jgi:hypothetical protein